MRKSGRLPLLAIDVGGASAVAFCVLTSVWLVVVRSDSATSETAALTSLVQTAQGDLAELRLKRDHQRKVLEARSTELAENGQLPEQTPVEEYFRRLSDLASRHQLRVVRQNPLAPREYPGLLEQRFVYEMTGSFQDLVRFLHAIENTGFWADVSYLELGSGNAVNGSRSDERVATLTLSLYSARPPDEEADTG